MRLQAFRALVLSVFLLGSRVLSAQGSSSAESPQEELQRLAQALNETQAQLQASQQQLLELRQALAALQQRMALQPNSAPEKAQEPANSSKPAAPQEEDLRDRQTTQETQIATLAQNKVESASKYPVQVSGLVLFNSFVNTSAVDIAPDPATAVRGTGSTGASLRQTVFGIEARGPHFAGAASHADVHVDFFGSETQAIYANLGGVLRLRTAHAALDWENTQAFVEFDRPLISPETPSSLVSMSQPALSWSGNLWAWVPQAGASHRFALSSGSRLDLAAALIDAPDPPVLTTTSTNTVSQAEASRWPGVEMHTGLNFGDQKGVGMGGYFSPHRLPGAGGYNAWAATLDLHTALPWSMSLSGNAYRGLALGGLGGGNYKDYVFRVVDGVTAARPLDDVGGWAQLKKNVGSWLEVNGVAGTDNAFAKEMRAYPLNASIFYSTLARNRTVLGNVILNPKGSLLMSLEYRHLWTTPLAGPQATTNIIGFGAGYKF